MIFRRGARVINRLEGEILMISLSYIVSVWKIILTQRSSYNNSFTRSYFWLW